ncbi:LON peptidase substrate-binding domain-containing protein [Algoriphagus pacificus]|uniref:LON peptidase substrate-binding domain-containing protein n=1 Tax=Algoriphagus pacificus TaxID=2811234 RepID=A0ABS3CPE8_9BACT|nr:LON peptidase substrate-binding domain-containing protein [Algoriphagus pacificus]MBN7818140.1 LON peptidase substrate-binding domain-containing protein [Algoriphagus pacificus]
MKMPFFPLKLVAFPGEELNLHIFEPRYKELIADIVATEGTFGVCVYNDKLMGFGTEVKLDKIHHRYEDGRLDIKTIGLRPFRIVDFKNPFEGKMYPGGEVEFLEDDLTITNVQQFEFLFYLKEMLYLLKYEVEVDPENVNSYTFAHKIGLKLEEELQLLQLGSEKERVDFLTDHFKRMIPAIKAIEKAKEKIRQNGHFKHLDPLNF